MVSKWFLFWGGYLQWDVGVQFEGGYFVRLRQEFFGVRVYVVVKDGFLRGEFDRFKFVDLLFVEFDSIIYELLENKNEVRVQLEEVERFVFGGWVFSVAVVYLVLEYGVVEGLEVGEYEVEFVEFFGGVGRRVFFREQVFEQVQDYLDDRDFGYRRDFFEFKAQFVQVRGQVFVEEDYQVGFFRLYFAFFNLVVYYFGGGGRRR